VGKLKRRTQTVDTSQSLFPNVASRKASSEAGDGIDPSLVWQLPFALCVGVWQRLPVDTETLGAQ
jgi:hypothetical protein